IKQIVIDTPNSVVNFEINGKVGAIKVLQPSQINLTGNSKNIPISVEKGAEGSQISSSISLSLTLYANTEIVLNKGAENTVIDKSASTIEAKVENKSEKPVVVTTNKTNAQTIDAGESGTSNGSPAPMPVPSTDFNFAAPVVQLSYEGYGLKWTDEFEGTSLNKDDWNIETHEAGWVNNELQEYVDSDQNISVKDGNLVITPIMTVGENGTVTYTSGRINTQNKHDFTYGLFEVRAKVPAGQGYLPAFWMMATDENLYGQWPRCGEIDIMEIMGQQKDKLYGTIHYGNPHSESQGTHVLTGDNFTDNYHTFSCEWEPGKISWYIDGVLYHEESDWYSATVGQGMITYPAPFDQPFYMILNLAVGGNWVGNPDATTDFENAAYAVDYVKVYQKDSYDENVTRPVKEVVLRDPDVNGNYLNNGDFLAIEDLKDKLNWESMTALGGEFVASISDNAIKISTTNAGTVDYSVQLVQAGIPLEKGATYTVSFDANASESRTLKTAVKGPDRGYAEYMTSKTVDLNTDKKTYTYEF
ncbi:MAG: family 16 glycosylhydrolase, partial [Mobilitalea sp.]